MINLREAGQHHELGDGSLYTKMQQKLPQAMLARYHRWIFENSKVKSVIALRTWILQEAEFQTIASETVHGLMGNCTDPTSQPAARYNNQQTFFGETTERRKPLNIHCLECRKQHRIWNCREFIRENCRSMECSKTPAAVLPLSSIRTPRQIMSPKSTIRTSCIILLHKPGPIEHKSLSLDNTEFKRTGDHDLSKPTTDRDTFLTEGNERTEQTTMVAQSHTRAVFKALRTVPVIFTDGDRSLKINVSLDDASCKTYININVADKLYLDGRIEKLTVNVLNGQAETSKPSQSEHNWQLKHGSQRLHSQQNHWEYACCRLEQVQDTMGKSAKHRLSIFS